MIITFTLNNPVLLKSCFTACFNFLNLFKRATQEFDLDTSIIANCRLLAFVLYSQAANLLLCFRQ